MIGQRARDLRRRIKARLTGLVSQPRPDPALAENVTAAGAAHLDALFRPPDTLYEEAGRMVTPPEPGAALQQAALAEGLNFEILEASVVRMLTDRSYFQSAARHADDLLTPFDETWLRHLLRPPSEAIFRHQIAALDGLLQSCAAYGQLHGLAGTRERKSVDLRNRLAGRPLDKSQMEA